MFRVPALLAVAPALGFASSLRTVERKLDSLDIFNDFLSDFTIEIDVGTSFAGIEVVDVECDSFSLDNLFITATLDTSSSPEVQSLVISGTGFDFDCDVLVDYGFFGTSTIGIPSDGSQFHLPLNFFSDEFGRIIPTSVSRDTTADCLGEMVIFNLDLGILGVVDVEGIIADELCPTLEDTLDGLADTFNALGLDEFASRPTQVASVAGAMADAEAAVEAILPTGFSLYDQTSFDAFTSSVADEILASPLATNAISLATQIATAYNAGQTANAVSLVEDLILLLTEVSVDIDEDFVDDVVDSGIIDLLTSGSVDVVDLTAAALELAGVDLPTAAEVSAIFDLLPEAFQSLLDPLESFLLSVIAEASSGSRRLQSFTDVVDLDALLENGLETTLDDVIDAINFPVLIIFYGDEVATALELYNSYLAGDAAAVDESLEALLLGFLGFDFDIPEEVVQAILDSGIVDSFIAGDISLGEAVDSLLALFGVSLPSAEEISSVFIFLPAEFAPLEDFLVDLVSGEGRRLQDLSSFLDLTVQDLVDLIDVSVDGVDIEAFLLSFGVDTTVIDLLSEIGSLFDSLISDLETTFSDGLSLSDTLPDSFLTLLDLVSILAPDAVGDLASEITANGGTLQGFADSFSFEATLDTFGSFSATVDTLSLSLDFSIDETDAGFAETSSFILPEFDISSLSISIGLNVVGTDESGSTFLNDGLDMTLDMSVTTQEAFTLGYDFTSLSSFDGSSVTSLVSGATVFGDYIACALSSVGVSFSAQRTVADVSSTVSSDGGLEGLIEDAAQIFADMYLPALPSTLESTASAFVEDLTFYFVESLSSSCA